MAPRGALVAAAATWAAAHGRPLSDAEMRAFYGYKYMAGPTKPLPRPLDASESLKDAAKRAGVYMGAAINYAGMEQGNQGPQYPQVALGQFDLFTAENECKWDATQPQPSQYTFQQCDYLTNAAYQNGSAFRFHNTCWGEQSPPWLDAIKDPKALTSYLQWHIGNVTSHYLAGGPNLHYYAIDVVNEAVSDSGNSTLKPVTPWYPALPDYINIAFNAAKAGQPDPNAPILRCYNDYGAEGLSSPKAQKVLGLIKELQAAGAPVNCVGLQMHISVDMHPTAADVAANIAALGALGMAVHITEMDVKCPNCTPDRLQAQAQVYADILGACLSQPNCKSFETWGLYDGDTWVGTENAPLLWDAKWNTKPAYDAVLATLQAHAAAKGA